MEKQRIQVYADPEIKRRVELAAAKHNMPVTEYCLNAIQQQLADDDLLEQAHIELPVTSTKKDDALLSDLRALREEILAQRGGKPIEIDILELVRDERDSELTGLR
jgi:uncharacterized protein (DUF1778 family)